jgi:hypothetical protein
MRAFRVGDHFRGNHSGLTAEVTWVDPNDHFRATVNCLRGDVIEQVDQTVFAAQFLNHWTLVREGQVSR